MCHLQTEHKKGGKRMIVINNLSYNYKNAKKKVWIIYQSSLALE